MASDKTDVIPSAASWTAMARELGMSKRQGQVAMCLMKGFGDKQIAQELKLSVPTVRTHMGRLFAKLGVGDRVELIVMLMNRYCADYCPCRQ